MVAPAMIGSVTIGQHSNMWYGPVAGDADRENGTVWSEGEKKCQDLF